MLPSSGPAAGLAHGLATQRLFAKTIATAECGLEGPLLSVPDGPVGIAAAGHVAQAIDDSGFAHGLATSLLFADTVAAQECAVRDGNLHLRPGPGLGVTIDEDALASRRIALG